MGYNDFSMDLYYKIFLNTFNKYLNDLDTFFLILSTEYNVRLYPRKSVIVFDEVQQYPKAKQSIKNLLNNHCVLLFELMFIHFQQYCRSEYF